MNKEVISSMGYAMDSLTTDAFSKGAWTLFVAFLTHTHTHLFAAFVVLVIVDLLSKWIALSHQRLVDNGVEKTSLWACIKNMRQAQRDGYIQSGPMKERFMGKVILYLVLVIAAAFGDMMMVEMNTHTFWVVLIVGYLTVCEMLSIVENLQAAGVDEASKLHELIQKKQDMLR